MKDKDKQLSNDYNKPTVSGSLPDYLISLISEMRFRLLVDLDNDGQPKSSIKELMDMWDIVNLILNIKTKT